MRVTPQAMAAARAGRPIPRREAEVMQAISRYLSWRSDVRLFWRQNSGVRRDRERRYFVRYGVKGISDFLGAWGPHGTLLAIEVKGGGRLTPEQKRFLDSVNAANGLGFVARSVEEVQTTLDRESARRHLGVIERSSDRL